MTFLAWHEEPIAKSHGRAAFDCGDGQMNEFLLRFARQSHEQTASKTFCAIDDAVPDRILGFYTIAPSALEHATVPDATTRCLAVMMCRALCLRDWLPTVRPTGTLPMAPNR
ncbi:hypothetical protein FHX15_004967 [Rhizobium sp. BK650]|nr:hypothetical protein [Rhizobium sp. BK650]